VYSTVAVRRIQKQWLQTPANVGLWINPHVHHVLYQEFTSQRESYQAGVQGFVADDWHTL
jgi:hypothetical protein